MSVIRETLRMTRVLFLAAFGFVNLELALEEMDKIGPRHARTPRD